MDATRKPPAGNADFTRGAVFFCEVGSFSQWRNISDTLGGGRCGRYVAEATNKRTDSQTDKQMDNTIA